MKATRILGIDPGTNILGFAVIEIDRDQVTVLEIGVLHLKEKKNPSDKLREIFLEIQEIIERYLPQDLAIEAPFFGKNVQSMLKLGRAQGVAMAAGMTMGLTITEYSPKKIKQSVTGNGNAAKEQVADMLCRMLNLKPEKLELDATDALSVALCHHYQSGRIVSSKKSGWKAFIKENPERVK
ncbi:MAG: crossover junction endodeoxyribonuclease RuvC [Saprospiraceae bacterium]|uniref:Crossover junction endodeoxyribonuclease RuvC n=1 Tax=Candidatus Opimibacter skivensis TaxID=2982028 RepID=A0A9D7SSU4_9BACT|nr:crossover junction endodeoxyribonuclease RuvC [Candidatus Opimibacter skivensis]